MDDNKSLITKVRSLELLETEQGKSNKEETHIIQHLCTDNYWDASRVGYPTTLEEENYDNTQDNLKNMMYHYLARGSNEISEVYTKENRYNGLVEYGQGFSNIIAVFITLSVVQFICLCRQCRLIWDKRDNKVYPKG